MKLSKQDRLRSSYLGRVLGTEDLSEVELDKSERVRLWLIISYGLEQKSPADMSQMKVILNEITAAWSSKINFPLA